MNPQRKKTSGSKRFRKAQRRPGRGEEATLTEGVRRYCSSGCNAFAIALDVQGQSINWNRGAWRTETAHQTRTGRRIWCSLQSTGWVTLAVCSSSAFVVGINSRRFLYPRHRLPHHPCWETLSSGRWSLASPALCLVSGRHSFAWARRRVEHLDLSCNLQSRCKGWRCSR